MKLLISFVVFFTGILYPQAIGGGTFPDVELNIQIQNAPSRMITFEFIPLGANWARTTDTGCNYNSYDDETTYISTIFDSDGDGDEDCYYNGYEYRFYNEGNERRVTNCAQSSAGLQPLRSGLYRINVWDNDEITTYAYFDWRDDGFPVSPVCRSCTGGNDMTIRYHGEDEVLWWWGNGSIDINNTDPNKILYQGQIITWADENCPPRSTTNLDDFWENCLVVTNNGNGNPRLVWGPNPDFENILGYKIYRAVHWVPNPDPIVYSLIATVDDDETFEYTDTQLKLSGNGDYVWYYVKAYNLQTESLSSNVVNTRAGFYKKNNFDKVSSTSYGLNQNFPNPFNPITQIEYTIKLAELVTIKVYDVLGNEVASLVNERKQPGNYSTKFNAANLPSGIYFYQLQSENFTDTKKMLMLK